MATKRPLVQGTVIQSSANLYNRLLGITSQALAIRVIGTEGYGLYQLSVPIFLLALVLVTAGIPLAVTKMVADERGRGNLAGIRSIMRWSLTWLLLLGTVFSILLALLWPLLARYWIFDPRAQWCILVLGLSLPVVATASALRGYFQGIQRMEIPALAQMLEQSVRVGSGLCLAHLLLPFGITWATAGYAAGVMLGELAGLLLLVAFYLKSSRCLSSFGVESQLMPQTILEKIALFAAPATLNRLLAAVVLNLEAAIIPRCLQASGYSREHSTGLYGQFMGIALTLVSIPSIATLAISANLMPAIASAQARNDHIYLRRSIGQCLKLVFALSLPFCVILWLVPQEITRILFGINETVDYIKILAAGGLGLYLIQIANSAHYGLGQSFRVLANTFLYLSLRIYLIFYFTSSIGGLTALAWAYFASYLVGAALNLNSLRQYLFPRRPPHLQTLLLGGIIMLLVAETAKNIFLVQRPISVSSLTLLLGLSFGVYLLAVFLGELYLGKKRFKYDASQ